MYTIPEEYRKLKLDEDQAFVYYKDAAAYIQMGGAL
jgi:hypothetical protein